MDLSDARRYFDSLGSGMLSGHKQRIFNLSWNPTGEFLASSSEDQTVKVWKFSKDQFSSKAIHSFEDHAKLVDGLCWNPKVETVLASASVDKTVRIWDTRAGKGVNVVNIGQKLIFIDWEGRGDLIAVLSNNDVISILDARKWEVVNKIERNYQVNEAKWSQSGKFFLATGLGTFEVVDNVENDPKLICSIQSHPTNVYTIAFDSKSHKFALGAADTLVSIWNEEEYLCERTLSVSASPIRSIDFSYDGKFLATASQDSEIDISYAPKGISVYKKSCAPPANSVAWHPSKYLLAFATDKSDVNYYGIRK